MKFLKTEGSLISVAHIELLSCLPRYSCRNGQDILSYWVVEVVLSSGGDVDLGHFDSERGAENYLNDLVTKLGIEVVK